MNKAAKAVTMMVLPMALQLRSLSALLDECVCGARVGVTFSGTFYQGLLRDTNQVSAVAALAKAWLSRCSGLHSALNNYVSYTEYMTGS